MANETRKSDLQWRISIKLVRLALSIAPHGTARDSLVSHFNEWIGECREMTEKQVKEREIMRLIVRKIPK